MEQEKREELSYIIATPYAIAKSRIGGIISRLLSRLELELVGAQLFAPSEEIAEAYAAALENDTPKLADYVRQNLMPSAGRRPRVLMMLFRGKDACRRLSDLVGPLYREDREDREGQETEAVKGETIRDTFGDLLIDPADPGRVLHLEPALFTPENQEIARKHMRIFADFIASEANVIEDIHYQKPKQIQRTLVILKPDNWQYASIRPGTIIDMFSQTGLSLIGCKVQWMSVAQAMEFYGPVKDVLREKLSPVFGKKASSLLEGEFGLALPDEVTQGISNSFGVHYAEDQFKQIVEFMTGVRPEEDHADEYQKPGKVKSMVLIYEGIDAVDRIRDVLGPTDPAKAPGGTVRRDFGTNIMVNSAHASDSPENAEREMGILKVQENNCGVILKEYLHRA